MMKRSSTNWSFFSKWSWNWLRILVLKPIDFSSTLSRLLCSAPWFSAQSIDRDSFWFRSGFRVRYPHRASSLVSRFVFTQHEPKVKELVHSSWSALLSIIIFLLYIGLTIKFFLQILMWSQITFLSSIRLTGGRQIDFKVPKPLKDKRKIFSRKLKILKFRKSIASTFTTNIFSKSKQTFVWSRQ